MVVDLPVNILIYCYFIHALNTHLLFQWFSVCSLCWTDLQIEPKFFPLDNWLRNLTETLALLVDLDNTGKSYSIMISIVAHMLTCLCNLSATSHAAHLSSSCFVCQSFCGADMPYPSMLKISIILAICEMLNPCWFHRVYVQHICNIFQAPYPLLMH